MNINISKIANIMLNVIYDEFDKLKEQYKMDDIYLNIYTTQAYMHHVIGCKIRNIYNDKDYKKKFNDYESCDKTLGSIIYDENLVSMDFKCDTTFRKGENPYSMIIYCIDTLYERIYCNLDNLDMLKEYLRINVRHEFGHALDALQLNNLEQNEREKVQKERDVIVEQKWKEFLEKRKLTKNEFHKNEKNFDEHYARFYLSLPYEKEAEELVGNDIEAHINLRNMLLNKHIIRLSKILKESWFEPDDTEY